MRYVMEYEVFESPLDCNVTALGLPSAAGHEQGPDGFYFVQEKKVYGPFEDVEGANTFKMEAGPSLGGRWFVAGGVAGCL